MAWEGAATIILHKNNGTTISVNQLAQNLPVSVESKPLDMGSDRLKQFAGIVLEIDGATPTDAGVDLAFMDRLDETPAWTETLVFNNQFQHFFPRTARFVKFRLRDNNPQTRWKAMSLSFYGMPLKGRW